MSSLTALLDHRAGLVTRFLDRHFSAAPDSTTPAVGSAASGLLESMRYSLLQNGAKRFRPVLAMMTAEALGYSAERVLPFAAAVECVHTYSLIHDDLPAMDNDDFRRGQPTNHKVFSEGMAILAGDALLTEAFQIIVRHYSSEPVACVSVIDELSRAAGPFGMVGGQAIDIRAQESQTGLTHLDELRLMHRMKTGDLIRAATIGAARLCFASPERLSQIGSYGSALGLAFQVADDILDFDPLAPEPGSFPALLGIEGARHYLAEITDGALDSLGSWGESANSLRDLAIFNRNRLL